MKLPIDIHQYLNQTIQLTIYHVYEVIQKCITYYTSAT